MTEADAHRALRERGVRFVHATTRYFRLMSFDAEQDVFEMQGSTIIGRHPGIQRFSELSQTFLYAMLYEPEALTRFDLRFNQFDQRRGLGVRIFELR